MGSKTEHLKGRMMAPKMGQKKVHLMDAHLVMWRAKRRDRCLGLNLAQYLVHWMVLGTDGCWEQKRAPC
jgi:hypothetical protein